MIVVRIVRCLVGATVCLLAASTLWSMDGDSSITVESVAGKTLKKSGLTSVVAGELKFADGSTMPADDLRAIQFPGTAPATATPAPTIVHLVGGGTIPAENALLVDDACEVTLAGDRKVSLALDDVAALQWASSVDERWSGALAKPSAEHDLVLVSGSPQATAIRVFIEKIGPESIEFDWDRQTRTLQRSQLIGVVFARPETPADVSLRVHVGVMVLPASELRLADDGRTFQCTLPQGSRIDLPLTEVGRIEFRSSRVKYLSDIEPTAVVERPIAALPRRWQADLNVRGEPLKAGGRSYDKGIGVQAGNSLTFELEGQAEQLVAILSLDSPGAIGGDCEFVVVVDGDERLRQSLKTGDDPSEIRVPLAGARRLEIKVDYGANLDFGDHANWCDAHLVLAPDGGKALSEVN